MEKKVLNVHLIHQISMVHVGKVTCYVRVEVCLIPVTKQQRAAHILSFSLQTIKVLSIPDSRTSPHEYKEEESKGRADRWCFEKDHHLEM